MIDLHKIDYSTFSLPIAQANKNNLFYAGLQFAPPARGPWNIVHQGFLMPESHEIFVGGEGCMRGVVLTAYEAGKEKQFSCITIKEHNVIDGTMEQQIIDGASDIIDRLEPKPKAIQMFSTCIHYFTGCDLEYCYGQLRKRYPNIRFTDCYMTPITQKSGITPDETMRRQLYSLIDINDRRDNGITLLGNNYPLDPDNELLQMIAKSGRPYRDICLTKTWKEYEELGKSKTFFYTIPSAAKGAEALVERIGGELKYYPVTYDLDKLEKADTEAASLLGVANFNTKEIHDKIENQLAKIAKTLQDWKVAIDYTATSAPLSLARLLLQHGIKVKIIYVEAVAREDKESFDYLKEHYPSLVLACPSHPAARFLHQKQEHVLAIGQKAAYYEGTDHFVNLIENSGLLGLSGVSKLLDLIEDAYATARDPSKIIQIKGWGCSK
ncbi:MAG: nitrogenase [Spirochaetia bacterium]|jgi:hypothetical protein|nr:nitrogenase [Spirochaetia bacterium]